MRLIYSILLLPLLLSTVSCSRWSNDYQQAKLECGPDVSEDFVYLKPVAAGLTGRVAGANVKWTVGAALQRAVTSRGCLAVPKMSIGRVQAELSADNEVWGRAINLRSDDRHAMRFIELEPILAPRSQAWLRCGLNLSDQQIAENRLLLIDPTTVDGSETLISSSPGQDRAGFNRREHTPWECILAPITRVDAVEVRTLEVVDRQALISGQDLARQPADAVSTVKLCVPGQMLDYSANRCIADQIVLPIDTVRIRQLDRIEDIPIALASGRSQDVVFRLDQSSCPGFNVESSVIRGALPASFTAASCVLRVQVRYKEGTVLSRSISVERIADPAFSPDLQTNLSFRAGDMIGPIVFPVLEDAAIRIDFNSACGWIAPLIKGQTLQGRVPSQLAPGTCSLTVTATRNGRVNVLPVSVTTSPGGVDCPIAPANIPNYNFDWMPSAFIETGSNEAQPLVFEHDGSYMLLSKTADGLSLYRRNFQAWQLETRLNYQDLVPLAYTPAESGIRIVAWSVATGRLVHLDEADGTWTLGEFFGRRWQKAPSILSNGNRIEAYGAVDGRLFQFNDYRRTSDVDGILLTSLEQPTSPKVLYDPIDPNVKHIVYREAQGLRHLLFRQEKLIKTAVITDCLSDEPELYWHPTSGPSIVAARDPYLTNYVWRNNRWYEVESRRFVAEQRPIVLWHQERSDLMRKDRISGEENLDSAITFLPTRGGIVQLGRLAMPSPQAKKMRDFYWPLAARCQAGSLQFPSPFDVDGKCVDGTTVYIAGMLCAAGETIGCETVAASQDSQGQFWRSPRKAEGEGADKSLSSTQSLGVMLYFAHTEPLKAKEDFEKWLTTLRPYLDEDPAKTCTTQQVLEGKCRFRFTLSGDRDCSDCKVSPLTWSLLSRLVSYYQRMLDQAGESLLIPELLVDQLLSSTAELDGSRLQNYLEAVIRDNRSDWNYTFVGSALVLRRKLGIKDEPDRVITEMLREARPRNPYFQLLSDSPDMKQVQEVVDSICPLALQSGERKQFRTWIWEQNENRMISSQAMGWDCIFIASLIRNRLESRVSFSDALLAEAGYICRRATVLTGTSPAEWIFAGNDEETRLGAYRAEQRTRGGDSIDLAEVALFYQKFTSLSDLEGNKIRIAKQLLLSRSRQEKSVEEVELIIQSITDGQLDLSRGSSIQSILELAVLETLRRYPANPFPLSSSLIDGNDNERSCQQKGYVTFSGPLDEYFYRRVIP